MYIYTYIYLNIYIYAYIYEYINKPRQHIKTQRLHFAYKDL